MRVTDALEMLAVRVPENEIPKDLKRPHDNPNVMSKIISACGTGLKC